MSQESDSVAGLHGSKSQESGLVTGLHGSKSQESGSAAGMHGRLGPCNCEHGQCLQMSCPCMVNGSACNGCGCKDCKNTVGNEKEITQAKKNLKSEGEGEGEGEGSTKLASGSEGWDPPMRRGCSCSTIRCATKRCLCYFFGVNCTSKCDCVASQCLNRDY